MAITDPERFAEWFNMSYRGAYRRVSVEDIRDMTECGLICRSRCYSPSQDGETIHAVLRYEQMRQKRSAKLLNECEPEQPSCKMCSQPLSPEPESNKKIQDAISND